MPETTDVTLSVEEEDMANDTAVDDVSEDICQLSLESILNTGEGTLLETMSNVESAHSVVRHSAARKFNQEDPLEAAAAAAILKKA